MDAPRAQGPAQSGRDVLLPDHLVEAGWAIGAVQSKGHRITLMRGADGRGRTVDCCPTPRAALSDRTPPGPEGSKGRQALTGARGVP